MNFEEINKRIEEKTEAKRMEEAAAANAAIVNGTASAPAPTNNVPLLLGTVVSKPGTERVLLDASSFQFMECQTAAQGMNKQRFCIVEKNTRAQYGNQFINSAGERAHVITRDLFTLLLGVLGNASKQIRELNGQTEMLKEQRDLYKMTIDVLRKNGVID